MAKSVLASHPRSQWTVGGELLCTTIVEALLVSEIDKFNEFSCLKYGRNVVASSISCCLRSIFANEYVPTSDQQRQLLHRANHAPPFADFCRLGCCRCHIHVMHEMDADLMPKSIRCLSIDIVHSSGPQMKYMAR